MKKMIATMMSAATLAAANAQEAPRTLVAYFSATGTTAAAQKLGKLLNGTTEDSIRTWVGK